MSLHNQCIIIIIMGNDNYMFQISGKFVGNKNSQITIRIVFHHSIIVFVNKLYFFFYA